ncbi:MAG: hypothetical protein QM589_14490 [Thermomicrobiales bacterium]
MFRIVAILICSLLAAPIPAPASSPATPDADPACQPSKPNGRDAPGMDSPGSWYGENGLYISLGLNTDGSYRVIHQPGQRGASNWDKQFFRSDLPEDMTVSLAFLGTRTITEAPRIMSYPSYHNGPFLNSSLWFPKPGCWQIALATPTCSLDVILWVVFPYPDEGTPTPAA